MIARIAFGAAVGAALLLSGCAASQKTFYADASKVKDTQLCRTFFESQQKGDVQFAQDLATEGDKRGLTIEECQNKVNAENGAILATALVAAAVGVGIACRDGCGGGGYSQPSYASSYADYDCAGGGGNGPYYVQGPFRLTGPDIYDLDRDGDGIACEIGEGGFGT